MKKYQRTMWTEENTKTALGTVVVILALVGMFFFAKYQAETGDSSLSQGAQFLVQGSGDNIEFAFDNNPNTAWEGSQGKSYNAMNYMIIDFGEKREVSKITMLLYGTGAPINYLVSIQSSNNANIWTDVIGGIETGFFTEKTNFEFPILKQDTRFLKIGIKPYGTSFQKFRVFEIMIN